MSEMFFFNFLLLDSNIDGLYCQIGNSQFQSHQGPGRRGDQEEGAGQA